MGLAGLLELGLDEFGVSYGGPKGGETFSCGRYSGVADPNVGANEVRLGGSWPAPFHTLTSV